MKNKILALMPLIALMGLTACGSDVVAKPVNYEDPIVTFNGSKEQSLEVYHNVSKIVEDAYHDGSLASDVLDKILYQYAVSIFGRYNKIAKGIDGESSDAITLKAAVADVNPITLVGGDIANEFINKHSAYWTTNSQGKRVDDDAKEIEGTNIPASKSECSRLIARWNAIEKLIANKLFSAVSGGSYSDRGIFSEYKYVHSLANSGKGVTLEGEFHSTIIKKSYKGEDAFNTILYRSHYQNKYGPGEEEDPNEKVNYVEKDLIPDIYKSLLVNQYLVDKKFNAIGNSYARKVNIIAIPKKTDFPKEDDYLLDEIVKEINRKPDYTPSEDEVKTSNFGRAPFAEERFDAYSNAWEGILDGEDSNSILDKIHTRDNNLFVKQTKGEDVYYEGTELGEMLKNYHELDKLGTSEYRKVDSSIISDFTGSGTYPKEVGRNIKTNDILVKDNTTKGWYISNGGLSNLPEAIRTRLFSFSVATAFKENLRDQNLDDRWQWDATKSDWVYTVKDEESSYLARINNAYYLKVSSSSQGSDPTDDILFYDASTSTHYIIQVVEAVRSAKLERDPEKVGDQVYPEDKKEEIINNVSELLTESGTYNSLANKYWLELATLEYHDQVVYDYFKSNYPELFEDK